MRVKHQPYINPMLAWWFVPFETYHSILISHMPHTAAWETKLASTFWVWSNLQARAVGYLWIILDLLPFLALLNANLPPPGNWTDGSQSSNRKGRPIMLRPFQTCPAKKKTPKTTAKFLTCTCFSQEIWRWEYPRRALAWPSWKMLIAMDLQFVSQVVRFTLMPNDSHVVVKLRCCFRINRRKTRQCWLFSNGILLTSLEHHGVV